MTDPHTILLGTRKGLFVVRGTGADWRIASHHFAGDPVSQLLADARDGGASFEQFREGLPQQHAYHLMYRHALEVAQDGVTLAMASTTGGLWVSADAGEQWQSLSRDLPPVAVLKFAA